MNLRKLIDFDRELASNFLEIHGWALNEDAFGFDDLGQQLFYSPGSTATLIAKYELSTNVSTSKGYPPYLHCGSDCSVLLCLHVTH